ncbi:MAG: carboxypeptidase-like regulatory domain-containing protein, partial [Chlamydiota bacterium]
MRRLPKSYALLLAFAVTLLFTSFPAFAQFTGSIQGVVTDPTGAGIPKATVTLVNQSTKVSTTSTTDASGNYRFVSLAPGAYKITAEAAGFAKTEANVNLLTEQNLNVPVSMRVGTATEAITVTGESPVVDTADSRNELTLQNNTVAQLPIPGRNLVTLTTLAPGVTGLGTTGGGQPGRAGTPGSGVDN